jgi:alkanesulfonate monooxygenase SsuD/methylene tetrahydromethanopterin reductase-like flavin-dependent oxidoreductase (luciferase family)
MQLDAMFPLDLAEAGTVAARLEAAGFDGLWTTETPHEPFLPLAAAALATTTMTLGSGIATAFTRSPMVTALTAWDLQAASGGRFVLGLGSQVKAHNERRYSVAGESPGPRFHGRFHTLDLMTPLHSPGPIAQPRIPIYLAAVRPYGFRLAGEIADGVHVHAFHTGRYLSDVALPALEEGLLRSVRTRDDVVLVGSLFAVIGDDPKRDRAARTQIAFYGSTSAYSDVFAAHGWGELTNRLKELVRGGDVAAMAAAIDDEVLDAFAIVAPDWEAAAAQVRARYSGVLDRVGFYGLHGLVEIDEAEAIGRALAARAVSDAALRPPLGAA